MASRPTAVIHIPAPAAGAFSKAQKDFNRLSKRIQKLEKELTNFRTAADDVRRLVQAEYRPLQAELNAARAELTGILDGAYHQEKKLTTRERTKIRELMTTALADLPALGHPELQPVLDRYAAEPAATAAAKKRAKAEAAFDGAATDLLRDLFEEQFGVRFDPKVDISTPEKFEAYAARLVAEQGARRHAEEEAAEARRATRKKSAKQLATEARKAAEEKATTQSVRALYRDLVKALHPDREPDAAEKIRKTALLQRVTAAYENNELLTLLRLQLELDRLDPAHLETLADAQLAPYVKLLRDQAQELEQTLFEEQMAEQQYAGPSAFFYGPPSAHTLRQNYELMKANLLTNIAGLTRALPYMRTDVAALKAFLTTV